MGSSDERIVETKSVPVGPASPQPVAHLDPTGVERVLKRAVELQAAEHGGLDGLDEQQLAEVANEIGIAPQHLRRALAEERAGLGRTGDATGLALRLLGPRQVAVGRPLRGDPKVLLGAGAQWLERQEGMRISRLLADGLSAEPDHRTVAWLRAGLGIARGTGHLRKADAVVLRLEPLDQTEVLVTAAADLGSARRRAAAGMGVVVVLSFLVAALAAGSLGPFAWVLASVFGGALAAAWRAELLREGLAVRRGLERTLDALGEAKPERPQLEGRVSGALEGARRFGKELRLLGEAIRDGLRPPKP